jgi:DNA-binding CsgD family transcriptional regulator
VPTSRVCTEVRLTKLHRRILLLIAQGYTNDEIADALYRSIQTIKTHIGRMLIRSGCRSRAHLAVWAVWVGAIELDSVLSEVHNGHHANQETSPQAP